MSSTSRNVYLQKDSPTVIKKKESHSVVASDTIMVACSSVILDIGVLHDTFPVCWWGIGCPSPPECDSESQSPQVVGSPLSSFESSRLRNANPYCMRVTPRPALEPRRAAWLVCRRYVRRKPINWKETETRRFQQNEKSEPVGNESMTISPAESGENGACIVVSQYGGTASACAEAYEGGASCLASSGTR